MEKTYPAYTHYIDLDLLEEAPFENIPKTWDDALAKYGEARLKQAGTLPWEIARRKDELTAAFREARWEDVVRQSAWIAHYLADATMPMHTTKDYLGRDAGNIVLEERGPNRSVHHRLEWGLFEKLPQRCEGIAGDPGNVSPLDDVLAESWKTVRHSWTLIPPVLAADRAAAAADDSFGETYYRYLDGVMRPLVSQQLRRSQELVASVWLSAWEDAGRPELPRTSWPGAIDIVIIAAAVIVLVGGGFYWRYRMIREHLRRKG